MNRKIIRSKQHLMNALLDILVTKDYNSITISDICHHAGYNRGTFYQNFKSKNNLLNSLIDLKLDEMIQVLKNTSVIDHRTNISDTALPLYKYINENKQFFEVILKDNTIIGFRYKVFLAYKDEFFQNNIEIPADDSRWNDVSTDFYYSNVTSAFLGVTMYWITNGMQKSPKYLTEQLYEIVYTRPHDFILGHTPFTRNAINENKKIDPRVSRTKSALKKSLLLLMQQKKYNQIKVNDILHMAEYNRSTFYSHYSDKDHLYNDVVHDLIRNMISSLLPLEIDHNKVDREGSGSPLLHLFSCFYDNRTLLKIMYSDNKVPGFFNKIYMNLCDFFTEELYGKIHVDAEIYAHYLVSTIMTTLGFWISELNMKFTPEYMEALYIQMLTKQPIQRFV